MTLPAGKTLTAMVHLPPLPGSINYDRENVNEICKQAAYEAQILQAAGFSEIMVQNTHDRPSALTAPIATTTAMAVITAAIRDSFDGQLGVNVHKNDAEGAIAVAYAAGATFVRIKVLVGAVIGPEGIINGVSDTAQRLRAQLDPTMAIWADLYELTSWSITPTSIENLADLTTRFGGADKIIVTSPTVDESLDAVQAARRTTTRPVLIGGRTDESNIAQALAGSDGVIVGSCLRANGRTTEPLDQAAIDRFITAVNSAA
jgi:uncharacterized protein